MFDPSNRNNPNKMNKHTPGPWIAEHGNMVRQDGGKLLATLIHRHTAMKNSLYPEPKEAEANARLIASAPDLLAACEEIIESMIDGPNSTQKNVTAYAINVVRSAIAKATQP